MLDPTPLSLTTRQAQAPASLARCQTQLPLTQLHTRSKCMWVWQGVKPNFLKLGYAPSPNACKFSKMSNPTPLNLTTSQAQVLASLARCQILAPLFLASC